MNLKFTLATEQDLPAIIALFVDDAIGSHREIPGPPVDPVYLKAFAEITADPNNELIVGKTTEIDGKTESQAIAVLQLTYIPNLTLKGAKRVQIEGVRVSSAFRGQKIGQKLFAFALQRARDRGCKLAQLTTNDARPDANRFYHHLGFQPSHVGFKLPL